MFEESRRLYTEEVNAAVRGALAAGATEIVAVDCHGAGGDWTFNSYVPELLHPDCDWVAHHRWSRYTELLEKGCDAALMVGMHARAGTPDGVMCHTISTAPSPLSPETRLPAVNLRRSWGMTRSMSP
jgi:D-amino peptidase